MKLIYYIGEERFEVEGVTAYLVGSDCLYCEGDDDPCEKCGRDMEEEE